MKQRRLQRQHGGTSWRPLPNSTLWPLLLLPPLLALTTASAKMMSGDKQEVGGGQWGRLVGADDQQQHRRHHYQQQQQQERNRGPADLLAARHGTSSGRCDSEADVTTLRHRIIRPQDSVSAGARFVSAPRGMRRWRDCLSACCAHAACSVAVLQGAPCDDGGGGGGDRGGGGDAGPELNCYLFDCPRGEDGRDVCSFSVHQGYTSFVLSEERRSGGGDGGGGADDDDDEKEEVDRKDEEEQREGHRGDTDGADGEEDQPPQAEAGADVMLRVPEGSATLSGLGSVDDHGITAYHWALVSGDPSLQMASSGDGQLNLSDLREGVYVLRLTVTDTANQQASDQVVVTVLSSPARTAAPSHQAPVLALPAKAPTVAQDVHVHNISEKMFPQPLQAQPLSMQTTHGAVQKQVDAVYVTPESSAVLPLALGLAVTVLLVMMIGGRVFVARKRLKRGRPLVSEESDYLINGMYL